MPKVRYLLSPLLSAFDFRHKKIALSATVFILLLTIGLSSNAYPRDGWQSGSLRQLNDVDSSIDPIQDDVIQYNSSEELWQFTDITISLDSVYLRQDGSTPLTSDWAWGSNNITGTGNFTTTLFGTFGNLTIGSGSITDLSGAISFGDENLTTTGIGTFGEIIDNGLNINEGIYTDGSKQLTSSIPTSGDLGYWTKAATVLNTATVGDDINMTGNITTLGTLTVGANANGADVKFFGSTSGKFMLWDESANALIVPDNVKHQFGNTQDGEISHSGTRMTIRSDATTASDSLLLRGGTGGIPFNIGTTEQMNLIDGVLHPTNDDDVDLGLSGRQWKNLFIDGKAEIDSADIGDGTNETQFSTTGVLTMIGTARVLRSVDFEPDAVKKGGVGPTDSTEDGFPIHDYQATNDESVHIHWEIPHDYASGEEIHIHVEYFVDTAPASEEFVTWGVEYQKLSIGDNWNFSSSTTVIVNDALTAGTPANDKSIHSSPEIHLVTTGFEPMDIVLIRIFRDANASEDGATDDFGSAARVFNYHLMHLSDKMGQGS